MAGNWFELFDFTVYGYFAVQIGRAYFPTHDPIASVLATFATYGVGFLMRPIGGMILGNYGDRRGRKKALALTMFIMAGTESYRAYSNLHTMGNRCARVASRLPDAPGFFDGR